MRWDSFRVLDSWLVNDALSGTVHGARVEARIGMRVHVVMVTILERELLGWSWPDGDRLPYAVLERKVEEALRSKLYDERPRPRISAGTRRHRRWKGAVR